MDLGARMKDSLRTVTELARRLGEAEFLREHPDAVLVVDPFEVSDEGFQTVKAGPSPPPLGEPSLAPLAKRGKNAFAAMVTVGRATNNDLVLEGRGVSKFHAFFTRGPGGEWLLVDAGSTYGTTVNDAKLPPRTERVPVPDGAVVRFGAVRTRFFSPQGLYRFLLAAQPRGVAR